MHIVPFSTSRSMAVSSRESREVKESALKEVGQIEACFRNEWGRSETSI